MIKKYGDIVIKYIIPWGLITTALTLAYESILRDDKVSNNAQFSIAILAGVIVYYLMLGIKARRNMWHESDQLLYRLNERYEILKIMRKDEEDNGLSYDDYLYLCQLNDAILREYEKRGLL